jgi:hypothetical protein
LVPSLTGESGTDKQPFVHIALNCPSNAAYICGEVIVDMIRDRFLGNNLRMFMRHEPDIDRNGALELTSSKTIRPPGLRTL